MRPPNEDEAPTGGAVRGLREQAQTVSLDFAGRTLADQAAIAIDGDRADQLLSRAQALAVRFRHLGIGPDLAGLSPADLPGIYRFLRRTAEGGCR